MRSESCIRPIFIIFPSLTSHSPPGIICSCNPRRIINQATKKAIPVLRWLALGVVESKTSLDGREGLHISKNPNPPNPHTSIDKPVNKPIPVVRCLALWMVERDYKYQKKNPPHPTPILSLLDVSNNSRTLLKSETNLTVGNEAARH